MNHDSAVEIPPNGRIAHLPGLDLYYEEYGPGETTAAGAADSSRAAHSDRRADR